MIMSLGPTVQTLLSLASDGLVRCAREELIYVLYCI